MANVSGRIWLLLASSSIHRRELREFARWIEMNGADSFVYSVEDLRQIANHGIGNPDLFKYPSIIRSEPINSELISKIETLLLAEAHLTRSVAADLLKSAIKEEVRENVPDLGRSSFAAWINRIGRVVPENVLLHLATRIRNEAVHASPPDWPLKTSGQ